MSEGFPLWKYPLIFHDAVVNLRAFVCVSMFVRLHEFMSLFK